MLVALAVAGRAADVRRGDGVPARHEVLRERREARREPRQPLRLRAAVHRDDDGERAVALRLEEEDGHRLAVEARVAVQRRLDERRRVDGARARRQPRQLARVEVVEVDVVRLDRAREREREQRAVRREDRMLDDAAAGQRHLVAQLERLRIVQRQPRVAVLVRDARAGCGRRRRRGSRDPTTTRHDERRRRARSRTCRARRSSRSTSDSPSQAGE